MEKRAFELQRCMQRRDMSTFADVIKCLEKQNVVAPETVSRPKLCGFLSLQLTLSQSPEQTATAPEIASHQKTIQ